MVETSSSGSGEGPGGGSPRGYSTKTRRGARLTPMPPAPSPWPGPLLSGSKLPRMPGQREGEEKEIGGKAARFSERTPSLSLARHFFKKLWESNGPGQGEGGMGRVRSA